MSNAMSVSKSRWKGALLAGAALAAVMPLAAKAQTPSMQVSLSLSGTTPTPAASYQYIAPDAIVPVYVWATVNEGAPVTSSNIAGLQYLYFNVDANIGAGAPAGNIQSTTLSSLFNGGNFNGSAGNTGAGAQGGAVLNPTLTSTPQIVVGDSSVATSMSKPRAANPIWSTSTNSNVVVNGNTVSFLVETINYQPTFTPLTNAPGGAGDQLDLSVTVPSLTGTAYTGANYFAGLSSVTVGSSVGAANTYSAYNASTAHVTLIDAQAGDVNLDGFVNGLDSAVINHNYGAGTGTDYGWTNGDLNGDGFVNGLDSAVINHNYGDGYGPADSFGPDALGSAIPTAQIGGGAASSVPEPTSLALLSVGSLALVRRRRTVK